MWDSCHRNLRRSPCIHRNHLSYQSSHWDLHWDVGLFQALPQSHFHRFPPVAGRCLDIGGFYRFHRRVTDVCTSVDIPPVIGRAPAGRRPMWQWLFFPWSKDLSNMNTPMPGGRPAGARPVPGRRPLVLTTIVRCPSDDRPIAGDIGRRPAGRRPIHGQSTFYQWQDVSLYRSIINKYSISKNLFHSKCICLTSNSHQ